MFLKKLEDELKKKEFVERIIQDGIKLLKYKDVENAIYNNTSPAREVMKEYKKYLSYPGVETIAKHTLLTHWDDVIIPIFKDKNKFHEFIISNKPQLKFLLNTKRGEKWLNFARKEIYVVLYNWIYENKLG